MNFKILNTIGEAFSPEARPILESLGTVDYRIPEQDELAGALAEYDIAVVGLGLTFSANVLGHASNLKAIATATTGLDHIDIEKAKEKGIEVISLRGETEFLDSITGTAELGWGLLLDLVRYTPWAFDEVKTYQWERENFRGYNLYGKTLGVVGLGRLGRLMARYGKAFGMDVLFCDPQVATRDASEYTKVSFGELLAKSDVVSINVHLLPETENMFGAAAFKKMKQNAYLINTSRGKIVHEDDLLEALKSGEIAGYGTDVLADELDFDTKGFSNHPLVEYAKENRNCVIVPHIGGMTHDSRIATDVFIAQKLARRVQKEEI